MVRTHVKVKAPAVRTAVLHRKQLTEERNAEAATPPLRSMTSGETFPHLGFRLGLRPKHYAPIFEQRPAVDWFEIISENFMERTAGQAQPSADQGNSIPS